MDDFFSVKHLQAFEQGVSEASDQSQTETLEVVFLDQFIQVCTVETNKQAKKRVRRGSGFISDDDDHDRSLVSIVYKLCYWNIVECINWTMTGYHTLDQEILRSILMFIASANTICL